MLTRSEQGLVSVEADLVLLHVGVYQHHAFNLVLNAVADEVVLQDKLLSKNEAEVDFSQQLVDEVVILPNEMI